jgi:hypothetical protein
MGRSKTNGRAEMKGLTNKQSLGMMLFAAFLAAACGSYYKIADPVTGNLYYAEEVKREGSAAVFKDGRTGSTVTLQNSEVSEISQEDYEAGLKTPKVQAK